MKLNQNLTLITFLICVTVLLSCNLKKDKTEIKPFRIQVIKNEKEIKLECTEGCAWKKLKFSKNNYQPQFVDEFGMSNSKDNQSKQVDGNLAIFLFSILKTDEGIELKGDEGTAWESLNFTLKNYEPQIITQMGMKE